MLSIGLSYSDAKTGFGIKTCQSGSTTSTKFYKYQSQVEKAKHQRHYIDNAFYIHLE